MTTESDQWIEWARGFAKLSAEDQRNFGDVLRRELATRSIDIIEMSVRSHNALMMAGIKTVGDLAKKRPDELMALPCFGRKCFVDVKDGLEALGFQIGSMNRL
jgi:DNA-directed RNA polymerase alpha subunit